MTAPVHQPPTPWWRRLLGCLCVRSWNDVLDLALILWIVRVPLATLAVGFLILYATPQAQDLLVGLVASSRHIAVFFAVLIFVWAMPTHYAARVLLDRDDRLRSYVNRLAQDIGVDDAQRRRNCVESMAKCVPRIFGIVPFLLIYIAIVRSYSNLPLIPDREYINSIKFDLWMFAAYVLVAIFLFAIYAINRQRLALRAPFPLTRGTGLVLLTILSVVFLVLVIWKPDWTAEVFPRASMVPLVLGGWLPVLSCLSDWGRRWRAPLILATLATIAIITALFGDNHSVRRINAQEVGGKPAERMTLNRAVELWMNANRCTGVDCPRPIIVAASGGASRAGFFTASIIGNLLQDASTYHLSETDIRNRLFAFSPVSGSAVGAVMTTAAFKISQNGGHPCVEKKFDLWYGVKIGNWRDCLEALVAGDFLTPTFIGLTFHDNIAFLGRTDRATLLERSWERRFAAVIDGGVHDRSQLPCETPLQCPFSLLRPTADKWVPLLLINGTSVQTGRRIVTTILNSNYQAKETCPTAHQMPQSADCLLLNQTIFFHDLLFEDSLPPLDFWAKVRLMTNWDYLHDRKVDDVSLSTAAHNSARFPLVSPPGAVRNDKHEVVDRIVDGGYFENYGALTALELAQAIRAVNKELFPFVVVISNNPDTPIDHEDDDPPSAKEEVKIIDPDPTQFLPDVSDSAETFLRSWDSRATLAVGQLRAALFRDMPKCNGRVSHVRVWPQTAEGSEKSRAVSMSWWLSEPVQRHLHQQTEPGKPPGGACPPRGTDENNNCPRLEKVWTALTETASCRH
jgi:hypothetical protein